MNRENLENSTVKDIYSKIEALQSQMLKLSEAKAKPQILRTTQILIAIVALGVGIFTFNSAMFQSAEQQMFNIRNELRSEIQNNRNEMRDIRGEIHDLETKSASYWLTVMNELKNSRGTHGTYFLGR